MRILIFLSILFLPLLTYAAPGDYSEADVVVHVGDDSVNVIEGTLMIENGEFVSIDESGSFISIWIDRPEIHGETIYFSGMIPGGASGDLSLFSISVREHSESVRLELQNLSAYLHDGSGSKVHFQDEELPLNQVDDEELVRDKTSPDNIEVEVIRDGAMLNSETAIAFWARDKGSGIDYYELSVNGGDFFEAESPYVFEVRSPRKVEVRAVDRHGNATSEEFRFSSGLPGVVISGILLLLLISVGVYVKKSRS